MYFKELRDADKRRAKLESQMSPEPMAMSPEPKVGSILFGLIDQVEEGHSTPSTAITVAAPAPAVVPSGGMLLPSVPAATAVAGTVDLRHTVSFMEMKPYSPCLPCFCSFSFETF